MTLLKINRFRILTVGKFDPLKVLTYSRGVEEGTIKSTIDYNGQNTFMNAFSNIVKNKIIIFIGDATLQTVKDTEKNLVASFIHMPSPNIHIDSIVSTRIRDLRHLTKNKAYLLNSQGKAQISIARICMLGQYSYQLEATLILLNNLLQPFLFNHLRGEKELG